jgi:hypothetical protein
VNLLSSSLTACRGIVPSVAVACAFLLGATPVTTPAPAAQPAAIYAQMATALARERPPPAMTYDETFKAQGLGVRIVASGPLSIVHIAFSSAGGATTFHVVEMPGRDTASILDTTSQQRYRAARPFWSPAWPRLPPGTAPPTILDAARATMLTDLRDPRATGYTITDAGVVMLGRVPEYHLRLSASGASAHPLTDVYVDVATGRIRSAFGAFTDTSVTNVTGTLQLNFGAIGAFWGITGGAVEATVHAFGRQVSGSAAFGIVDGTTKSGIANASRV